MLRSGDIDKATYEKNVKEIAEGADLKLETDIKGNLIVDEEDFKNKMEELAPGEMEAIELRAKYNVNESDMEEATNALQE